MKTLGPDNFARARAYLLNEARPLERALFRYHFEDGTAVAVWQELAAFQNGDGGFGHALEPDVRTPTSSALATGIALRTLAEIGAPPEHPMAQDAVGYLKKTLDPQTLTWRVVPPDSNDYPHAPWWHDEDGSLSVTFDAFQIIPRAELVAYLHAFSDLALEPWLEDVTEAAVLAVDGLPLGGGGGDDLVYALRLAGAEHLSAENRELLQRRVREAAPAAVTRDPARWATYSIPPLKLAPSPDSLVADLFAEDIQKNLDYVIDRQTAGGYWEPTWDWGGFYPDAWQGARDEWRGEITLHNLLALRAYGRL
ncbi:MAG: hypothetical protein ACK2U5_17330 [Candidatus Promineifilaceae bacterium]|jgi:hypothetical protein